MQHDYPTVERHISLTNITSQSEYDLPFSAS